MAFHIIQEMQPRLLAEEKDTRMGIADLFRPKWKHSNPNVRLDAVKALSNQAVLAEIAKNDEYGSVRCAALKRITDQGVAAEIARNDKTWTIREAAVEYVTDQCVLADVANKDNVERV